MADHDESREDLPGPGQAPEPPADPAAAADAGLSDLRARLGELQGKVELLGSQGVWPEPPAVPPMPPPAQTEYTPGYQPPAEYGPPADYQPPAEYGYGPPAEYGQPAPYQPPAQPPAAPPPYTPEPVSEPQPAAYPPPPVATNGHTEDTREVSARSTTVALVDAGPFDDLIQLRHFEDELSSLHAVRDVRVRRFGHGRASIEVGMTGPYSLSRELYRLGRQMEIADGPAGDLIIHLAPPPEEAVAEEEAGPDLASGGLTEGAA